MELTEFTDWQAENLRLSVFLSEAAQMDTQYWESLIGNLPDVQHSQPQRATYIEEGKYEDAKLRVQSTPNRIDWLLFQDFQYADNFLPILGEFSTWNQRFHNLMLRWFTECPLVNRIAFGCVLLLPSTDLGATHEKLGSFLPNFEVGDGDFKDFILRINRDRTFKIGNNDLKINRLSTWSAELPISGQIRIKIDDSEERQNQPIVADTQRFESLSLCRLELDINTAANRVEPFNNHELPIIFETLVEYGNEIASKGDVA